MTGMIKNGTDYNDIYNYRNSKYFINSVIEAKKAVRGGKDLVIFAGACQSFFEAIMASRSKFCLISCKGFDRFYGPISSCRENCNHRQKQNNNRKRYIRRATETEERE